MIREADLPNSSFYPLIDLCIKVKLFICCFLVTLLVPTPFVWADTISAIAGYGSVGANGDGGVATAAQFQYPQGMVYDSNGNLYIADFANNKIRKINTNGIISTFAGTGAAGAAGDGGPAASAQLNYPFDVAFDASGNLYVADYSNHKIRKVDTNGIISTFAGTGTGGHTGDGGMAASAQLNKPSSLEFDASGNLYIVSHWSHAIRKVNTSGIISTIAGTGTAGFSGDGGVAASAQLDRPVGLAIAPDGSGVIYITDYGNHRVRKLTPSGGGLYHQHHRRDGHGGVQRR